jgi:hypothetical protein
MLCAQRHNTAARRRVSAHTRTRGKRNTHALRAAPAPRLGGGVRHVDLAQDGVAVVGQHDACAAGGRGVQRGARVSVCVAGGGRKRNAPRARVTRSAPRRKKRARTAGGVQQHLQHRARAQRRADDVRHSLRHKKTQRRGGGGGGGVCRDGRKNVSAAARCVLALRAARWRARALAAAMLPVCALRPVSRFVFWSARDSAARRGAAARQRRQGFACAVRARQGSLRPHARARLGRALSTMIGCPPPIAMAAAGGGRRG